MDAVPAPARAVHVSSPSAAPVHYVPLPRRLLLDLRDAPVAAGAYALLARVYRATGQPVPLSPGDLQAYDPALSYGAATRALQHLVASGWLLATRRPGRKTVYAPAWGPVRGEPLPWDLAAPCLGRPRHVTALRLDQRLLDVCMGRLDPHPTHPALVHRYLEAPLLGLRETGAYALALAGLPTASARLEELRFVEGGQPLSLPDEATILAVASQGGERALSAAGWRRTPFGDTAGPTPAEAAPGQALFFVPPGQIGPMIGGVIAGPITISTATDPHPDASDCHEQPAAETQAGSHGVMERDGENPTTHSASTVYQPVAGGGAQLFSMDVIDQGQGIVPNPQPPTPNPQLPTPSETERLLQGIGVRRGIARALADRSKAHVARLIAQARARADVRDLAGWVVAALRELPDAPVEAPPPAPASPATILFHPALSGYERQVWLGRFRAADPADRQSVLDRFYREVGHVSVN